MGNEATKSQYRVAQRRERYRTVQQSFLSNRGRRQARHFDPNFEDIGSSLVAPPINQSLDNKKIQINHYEKVQHKQKSQNDEDADDGDNEEDNERLKNRRYHSIDIDERNVQTPRKATPRKVQKYERDRILQALSKKNQQLRKQLKQISQDLTNRLKQKKLIPKKAPSTQSSSNSDNPKVSDKEQIGLKRELENGYKQVEMYKKILLNLKNKSEGITADHRLNVLENQIAEKNLDIQKLQQKKITLEKVINKQSQFIKQDINDDVQSSIDLYKREIAQLQAKLKKMAKDDRTKQELYKKQQAYVCDLQKKWRQISQLYFPDINNKLKKDQLKPATSQKDLNPSQFYHIAEQARRLRIKHEQYNRRIQILLQAKNKRIEEQNDLKDMILYKERIIDALKIKIGSLYQLLKPRRNSMFGSDSQQNLSDFNDNQSEMERELQEELKQDQFDIKHLIANIPKPVRKKQQELSNGNSSSVDLNVEKKPGSLQITNEKAQPKKWGAITSRSQERGKHKKGQHTFEDKPNFQPNIQPIMVGLNMWINKNNTIVSIQGIYLHNNQLLYGTKSSNTAQGIPTRFDLQFPDYIKNLSLTITNEGYIESMTFYSKHGKIAKFGNKRGIDQFVNFGLASNQRPFSIFGASLQVDGEARLNRFGVQICTE